MSLLFQQRTTRVRRETSHFALITAYDRPSITRESISPESDNTCSFDAHPDLVSSMEVCSCGDGCYAILRAQTSVSKTNQLLIFVDLDVHIRFCIRHNICPKEICARHGRCENASSHVVGIALVVQDVVKFQMRFLGLVCIGT